MGYESEEEGNAFDDGGNGEVGFDIPHVLRDGFIRVERS